MRDISPFDKIPYTEIVERFPKELLQSDLFLCLDAINTKFNKSNRNWHLSKFIVDTLYYLDWYTEFIGFKHLLLILRPYNNQIPLWNIKLKLTHELLDKPFETNLYLYFCRKNSFLRELYLFLKEYGLNLDLEDLKCEMV
jgi:hypothetical protein